jgi:hypothetical protein
MWKVIRGCLPIKEITEPNYRKDPGLAAEEFNINYSAMLPKHQSGSRKLHSTETLSIAVTDILLEAIDKKQLYRLLNF